MTISGNESYYGSIRLTFEIKAAASTGQDQKPSGQRPSEQKPSASNMALKPGTVKTDSKTKNVYKVKTASTVELKQLKNKNASMVTIPSAVKFNGKTYRVTSIAAGAFKNNKNLKKVTISGYITTVGAGAFQNCASLTTVKNGKPCNDHRFESLLRLPETDNGCSWQKCQNDRKPVLCKLCFPSENDASGKSRKNRKQGFL